MKKDLGAIPAVFPMPVLIVAAYDGTGRVQAMNAAWGTICAMDRICLCIDEDHATTKAIRETGAFTVSLADVDHMAEADYLGIATGNKLADKFQKSGLTETASTTVHAPIIDQFPVTLECELADIIDTDSLHAVIGQIKNVKADEEVLSDNGKIDPVKVNALIFDQFQNGYYVATEQTGKAWNAGVALNKAARA